ncbi:unnamed protein product [Moneuplotes crassus]|uniref:Uncharacterized protein n=1 Tax=Euplotes crassus TaxID=5936 RepID=A0AAD1U6U8_EUPCR|nr:unnamed protein product [Moneuplotes crassus]
MADWEDVKVMKRKFRISRATMDHIRNVNSYLKNRDGIKYSSKACKEGIPKHSSSLLKTKIHPPNKQYNPILIKQVTQQNKKQKGTVLCREGEPERKKRNKMKINLVLKKPKQEYQDLEDEEGVKTEYLASSCRNNEGKRARSCMKSAYLLTPKEHGQDIGVKKRMRSNKKILTNRSTSRNINSNVSEYNSLVKKRLASKRCDVSVSARSVYNNIEPEQRKLSPHKKVNPLMTDEGTSQDKSKIKINMSKKTRNAHSIRCLPRLNSNPKEKLPINITISGDHNKTQNSQLKKIVNIDLYNRKNSKASIYFSKPTKNIKQVKSVQDIHHHTTRSKSTQRAPTNTLLNPNFTTQRKTSPPQKSHKLKTITDKSSPHSEILASSYRDSTKLKIKRADLGFGFRDLYAKVPKTSEELEEYAKFQNKKIRLAKIIDKRVEHESSILLKKQSKEACRVMDKPGICADVKMFMFRQPPINNLKSFEMLGSRENSYEHTSIGENLGLLGKSIVEKKPVIISKYSLCSTKLRKKINNIFNN